MNTIRKTALLISFFSIAIVANPILTVLKDGFLSPVSPAPTSYISIGYSFTEIFDTDLYKYGNQFEESWMVYNYSQWWNQPICNIHTEYAHPLTSRLYIGGIMDFSLHGTGTSELSDSSHMQFSLALRPTWDIFHYGFVRLSLNPDAGFSYEVINVNNYDSYDEPKTFTHKSHLEYIANYISIGASLAGTLRNDLELAFFAQASAHKRSIPINEEGKTGVVSKRYGVNTVGLKLIIPVNKIIKQ